MRWLLLFIIYNHKQLYYSHFFYYFKEAISLGCAEALFVGFEMETVVSRVVFSLHEEFQVLYRQN